MKNAPAVYFSSYPKAFDTLNQDVLLKKLEIYDTRRITNILFKLFLKGRKQYATIRGIKSDQNLTDSVSLQGSVLGLLLFIAFMIFTKQMDTLLCI